MVQWAGHKVALDKPQSKCVCLIKWSDRLGSQAARDHGPQTNNMGNASMQAVVFLATALLETHLQECSQPF